MLQHLCTPETDLIQFFLSQTLCLHLGCPARCTDAKVGIAWNWCTHESLTWRQNPKHLEHRATQIVSHRSAFATGACTKCTRYTWRRPWHRKDGMEIWPFCLGLFLQQAFRLEMKSKGLKGLFKSFYNECLMYWVVHCELLARQSDQFWQFYTYNHSAPCGANCICLPRKSDLTCCMKNLCSVSNYCSMFSRKERKNLLSGNFVSSSHLFTSKIAFNLHLRDIFQGVHLDLGIRTLTPLL